MGNLFQSVSNRVKDLREELDNWHTWPTAETNRQTIKQTARLEHDEKTLAFLAELTESKAKRRADGRKTETGSRLLLCLCTECEYRMRVTFIHIARAIPICPDPECPKFQQPMEHEMPNVSGGEYNENMARNYAPEKYIPELREQQVKKDVAVNTDDPFDDPKYR